MPEDLRQTIRGILIEELTARGVSVDAAAAPAAREETIAITCDRDLAKFIKRLLKLTKNSRLRADIETGRYRFRLAQQVHQPTASAGSGQPVAAQKVVRFDSGLITEKQINSLPDDVAVVRAGISVKFTPLAMDAVRQGGIKVERLKT